MFVQWGYKSRARLVQTCWRKRLLDGYTADPVRCSCSIYSMHSRRTQAWIWWLLPFLVARALMPVGFMAQAMDGKLQIVFCSAGFAQAGLSHGADHDANKHAGAQNDFSCPFAHVAAAPMPLFTGSESIPFLATAEIVPPAESPYYAAGPPRFIATRGPPSLS